MHTRLVVGLFGEPPTPDMDRRSRQHDRNVMPPPKIPDHQPPPPPSRIASSAVREGSRPCGAVPNRLLSGPWQTRGRGTCVRVGARRPLRQGRPLHRREGRRRHSGCRWGRGGRQLWSGCGMHLGRPTQGERRFILMPCVGLKRRTAILMLMMVLVPIRVLGRLAWRGKR